MESGGKVMKSQSLQHYYTIICTVHRPWNSLQTGPLAGKRPEPSVNEDYYKVHSTCFVQIQSQGRLKQKTSTHLLKFRMNEHKSFSVIPALKGKKLEIDFSSYSRIKKNPELIH